MRRFDTPNWLNFMMWGMPFDLPQLAGEDEVNEPTETEQTETEEISTQIEIPEWYKPPNGGMAVRRSALPPEDPESESSYVQNVLGKDPEKYGLPPVHGGGYLRKLEALLEEKSTHISNLEADLAVVCQALQDYSNGERNSLLVEMIYTHFPNIKEIT